MTIARLRVTLDRDGPLKPGMVIVLDEVSQTSTRDAETVLAAVAACVGGQLWVLRQGQPVLAGGLAHHLATLTQDVRISAERRRGGPQRQDPPPPQGQRRRPRPGPGRPGLGWLPAPPVGDRALFHTRCGGRSSGIVNGTTATVLAAGSTGIIVRLDGAAGRKAEVEAAFLRPRPTPSRAQRRPPPEELQPLDGPRRHINTSQSVAT